MFCPPLRGLLFLRLAVLWVCVAFCGCEKGTEYGGVRPCPEPVPMIIYTDEVWGPADSPVIIDRDVYVTRMGRLTVLPGTTVQFEPGAVTVCDPAGNLSREANFYVEGELICQGAAEREVHFVGSGEFYPFGTGWVYINHQGRESDESVIEWSTIPYVEWHGGSPSISNSHIHWLSLESPVGASIASNVIGDLYVGRGTGEVVSNLIERHLHLYGGSIEVTRNTLRSVADGTWGAISTCAGNTSLITENVIQNCQLGMLIFAAAPELHRNNFEGNVMNLGILPEFQRPDTGTVDATNNWWGTIDESEVASKIEYMRNGDTVSQKTVVYLPIALQPFQLATMPPWL